MRTCGPAKYQLPRRVHLIIPRAGPDFHGRKNCCAEITSAAGSGRGPRVDGLISASFTALFQPARRSTGCPPLSPIPRYFSTTMIIIIGCQWLVIVTVRESVKLNLNLPRFGPSLIGSSPWQACAHGGTSRNVREQKWAEERAKGRKVEEERWAERERGREREAVEGISSKNEHARLQVANWEELYRRDPVVLPRLDDNYHVWCAPYGR